MLSTEEQQRAESQAAQIAAELADVQGSGSLCKHAARRRVTRYVKGESGLHVMAVARERRDVHGRRWFSRCVVRYHKEAFQSLDDAEVEAFGQAIDSRAIVDSYARILSGTAWVQGLVSDELIHRWARSEDGWWRRAALVSTVALNIRSQGGMGDRPRTLDVCRVLVDDRDDMVCTALSWGLRALLAHDPEAVRAFVAEHDGRIATQVRREVLNKLETGLKSSRR